MPVSEKKKRKKASVSPTQLSLAWIRGMTHISQAEVVERWNPYAKIRQDLFNCIDIIGVTFGRICFVQCTSWAHAKERCEKISTEPRMQEIIRASERSPGAFEVIVMGWKKPGKRGSFHKAKVFSWRAQGWKESVIELDYNNYIKEKKKG